MIEAGKNLEGQVVDGKFPLLRCLGESDHSVVFLTERKLEAQKAAIKLLPATSSDTELQISRWEAAAKLSHPHLVRLWETGRCSIGNMAYCYVVMEYAEENLYQILPDRPLSADEARAMLPSVLDALSYLHQQGFVHGHIKPTNIMASGDQVKLSSDGVLRMGQAGKVTRTVSLYDPPEANHTGLHPTQDLWSLGVTLVEALTQHPPARVGIPQDQDFLPQSLPSPFSDIIRNCLRARPEQRWSIEQIAASLNPSASSQPAVPDRNIPKPPQTSEPPALAKPWVLIGTSTLALILLIFFFVRVLHHPPAQLSSSGTTIPQPSSPAPAPEPAVVPKTVLQSAPAPVATPPATPAPESSQPDNLGAVAQKVLPEVPRSASRTIHGTIRVKIRVKVNASGNVSSATFVSSGSSSYFAKLALQAAQKWRFEPARKNGQETSSTWILKFEFRQNGSRASADRTS